MKNPPLIEVGSQDKFVVKQHILQQALLHNSECGAGTVLGLLKSFIKMVFRKLIPASLPLVKAVL